jgi:xylan 1,4-beta-xylosidase
MSNPTPATLRIDLANPIGQLRPIWRFFGYDEPNYTYMRGGQKLLSELAALSRDTVFVRTHNLLTSGNGTPALKWGSTNAYTEDADGNPIYDWTITDRIFDTYLARGLKPFVQIGFMPEALSTKPIPYQHDWAPDKKNPLATGWAYPPKDYAKWGELVYQWATHCAEKYGIAEAESWYWEVWNEPNIFYWQGTAKEYHVLYDYAADGVKRALPNARVGGPHIAGTRTNEAAQFLQDFLVHCVRGKNHATGATGAPLDFIAFHAKGAPKYVDNHVRMGIAEQLQNIDRGFAIVASFPQLKHLPIIIGESDPDGCAACSAEFFPQNGYRNGVLFAAYTAAVFARKHALAEQHGVNFEGALTWAFEFEDQPYFAGFRVLSSNGIGLPVLNVFRMFGQMRGQQLRVSSDGGASLESILAEGVPNKPDIHAFASADGNCIWVMVWHYHDDDLPASPASVSLSLMGLPSDAKRALLHHYRIDNEHSNAFEAWKSMGSPQAPSAEQYAALEQASQLALLSSPEWVDVTNSEMAVKFELPRHGVSLLRVEW